MPRPKNIPALADLPDLLDVRDLAALMQKKEGVIRELARRGDIPCIRLGSRYRFSKAEIAAYLRLAPAALPQLQSAGLDVELIHQAARVLVELGRRLGISP